MTLTTVQAAILAAELSTLAVALCLVVALISQDGPARRGRHSAPPTTPPPSSPATEPDPGPRHLAPDWREQITVPAGEPVLVRPYVAHLGAVAR